MVWDSAHGNLIREIPGSGEELGVHSGLDRGASRALAKSLPSTARRIIAGLVERIPAIEAPQEAPEASATVEEEPERAEPRRPATVEAQ